MAKTKYYISGTQHKTGRKIAIIRNDITEISINKCLMHIDFENREQLVLDCDYPISMLERGTYKFLATLPVNTYGLAFNEYK